MKKNFPRKIRPGSRSAVAFFEGSCRRRSTLDRRLSTDSRPQPKTLNQEPSEKLQLLALSCTYLQLLAPNCSSHFPRSFLRLRSSDGGATSELTRQTTNSTSAHRQFNICPHQLNSDEPHLHPATPNYTQLHQKNFFPSELKLKPNSPSVPCSFFIRVNP